ncbi:MAG TPA: hypothetical protein VHF89_00595 [Solirubrobacteraceae bacterium]|nr:hypothetical protein [Solirubrobacteraceae bacterium]
MEAYGRVLRVPHVRWLLTTALLARVPYGIEALATVLFVHEQQGSFAAAGAVSAAGALAAGIGLPILGRLIDVLGQTRVLVAVSVVHLAAGAALVLLGEAGASTAELAALAAVGGLAVPPISPSLRSLWPGVLGDDPRMLRSALALDAISLEAAFIGGPLLTAALVELVSPGAALMTGFAVAAGGALSFATAQPSRRWRGSGTASFGLGPLRSRGLRTLLVGAAPLGFAFGSLDVALPAFGVAEGSRGTGAICVAALAVGSAICGVLYGARPPARIARTYVVLSVLLPLGVLLLALPASLAAMVLLAPAAGAVLAPITAAANELAGDVAPAGTVTEAYAWVITSTIGGVALGTAVAGAVVEGAGWREAIVVGAAGAAAGAALVVARRGTLHATP